MAPVLSATTLADDPVLVSPEERHEAESEHVAHLELAQHAAAVAAQAVDGTTAHHVSLLVTHEAEKHRRSHCHFTSTRLR